MVFLKLGIEVQKPGTRKIMNRYRSYLFIQIIVVIFVILAFKTIESKKIAAALNTFLFLASTGYILLKERKIPKSFTFWGSLAFLILGILPIGLLRLFYWESDFNSVSVAGIFTASELHKFSNYPFVILLVCLFIDSNRLNSSMKKQIGN